MPKQVDHAERRREISAAVARLAVSRGLQGISFREVATEAGMSVSLVQHYFGTKANLLVGTLDIESAQLGEHVLGRLGELPPEARPLDRVGVIARMFLALDEESRTAMLLYHGFAAAALTDGHLRRADAFRNADSLVAAISAQLVEARDAGELRGGVDPDVAARGLLALVLGLSYGVLLGQTSVGDTEAVLDAHLAGLAADDAR